LGMSDPIPAMKLASEVVIPDDVMLKAKNPLSRAEILSLKNKLERVLRKLESLTKASPILDEHSKKGGQASEERSSAPQGGTKNLNGFLFDDTTLNDHMVGKR